MLDKQVHIYSLDTSAFYTDEEKVIEEKINNLSYDKTRLKEERAILLQVLSGELTTEKAQAKYRALYRLDKDTEIILGGQARLDEIKRELKERNRGVKEGKDSLSSMLRAHSGTRALREEYIVDKNVISVFESMLTRTLGMQTGNLYDDFMVIRTYYFDVIKDLILNGYTYKGQKYVCLTASAGQIRTKKVVFIKEDVWRAHKDTLMCGLTVEGINAKGGININKYLAYLALCSSATDLWADFDIHRTIVVDDMETLVNGEVDFIDHRTYQIERRYMDIPITHTDGCGMVLPQCCKNNTMVRLPWIKGLLAVFPFDKFIRDANKKEPEINHGIITDIYGAQHDILAEGIQVIFTKSQFKMYQFYSSWDEYIKLYQENGCSAGKCNEERDYIPSTKLGYQMLQTLTDMSRTELEGLAEKTIDRITRIATDRDTMLEVFGAKAEYPDKNDFQECLCVYPELLADPFTKEMLRQIKKNLVKEARAGKLLINGKYTFLIPDLYAFCQWLFLGDKNPAGLLQNGEVSCSLYRIADKLDCLRSPHLYREHAVRHNKVNAVTRRWFTTKGIYTSCHDLISKILQFDCDGDTSLVSADPLLISIAERNMQGVVPLYYEMAKAGAVKISADAIYTGMRSAWKYGNIGTISNNITKIWNSGAPDLELIKIQTCENNFSIDAAKTLYMPERPANVATRLDLATKAKVPHFFIYAKNKDTGQVETVNSSIVNQLESVVPNKRMSFTAKNVGRFEYRYMLSRYHTKVNIDSAVISLYDEAEKQYRFSLSYSDSYFDEENTNAIYIRNVILKSFAELGYSLSEVNDMLVKHLFRNMTSKRKALFWLCFGDIVLDNLRRNLPAHSKQCVKCGKRFVPSAPNQRLCKLCGTYQPVAKRKKAEAAQKPKRKQAKNKAA